MPKAYGSKANKAHLVGRFIPFPHPLGKFVMRRVAGLPAYNVLAKAYRNSSHG